MGAARVRTEAVNAHWGRLDILWNERHYRRGSVSEISVISAFVGLRCVEDMKICGFLSTRRDREKKQETATLYSLSEGSVKLQTLNGSIQ